MKTFKKIVKVIGLLVVCQCAYAVDDGIDRSSLPSPIKPKVFRHARIGTQIVARSNSAGKKRRSGKLSFSGARRSDSEITWTWNCLDHAYGYQVFSSSGAALSVNLSANTTFYLQTGILPGVSYGAYLVAQTSRGEFRTRVATVTIAADEIGGIRLESAPSGPDPSFRLGEVYVYPNPAKAGAKPTFHVEVGIADSVKLKVYNVAGEPVHATTLTAIPQAIDDGNGLSYAYEYVWDGHIPSGVYYYTMEAVKGPNKLRKAGKLAVIR